MKLKKFAYLYSKPLGNHTLKIMKKIPANLLKNLEKSWKYHGILSVRKSGNPEYVKHARKHVRYQDRCISIFYSSNQIVERLGGPLGEIVTISAHNHVFSYWWLVRVTLVVA